MTAILAAVFFGTVAGLGIKVLWSAAIIVGDHRTGRPWRAAIGSEWGRSWSPLPRRRRRSSGLHASPAALCALPDDCPMGPEPHLYMAPSGRTPFCCVRQPIEEDR